MKLLKVDEVAKKLGVTVGTVKIWARNRKLIGIQLGENGMWRFEQVDIESYLIGDDQISIARPFKWPEPEHHYSFANSKIHNPFGNMKKKSPDPTIRLLKSKEIAEVLNVAVGTVKTWARNGELSGKKLDSNGMWRFQQTEVEAYVNRHKSTLHNPFGNVKLHGK
ncbi:helix-turn-helix domain-containing protein [Pelosinus sp. sgz500959]|uniref:helix-turn-helix domain-containing protein n=1 Tax=Pelosinus sp. sgz500959 TaxID=3242472 RepID=UPI00366E384B